MFASFLNTFLPTHALIYLNVPYSQKEFAKTNHMRWCPHRKLWYYKIDIQFLDREDLENELINEFNKNLLVFDFHSLYFNIDYCCRNEINDLFKEKFNLLRK